MQRHQKKNNVLLHYSENAPNLTIKTKLFLYSIINFHRRVEWSSRKISRPVSYVSNDHPTATFILHKTRKSF